MTTSQIAKLAGVSQATVSRVINRYPNVSPATVELVQQAMQQVGYRPRQRMRRSPSSKQRTSQTVAVLTLDDSYQQHPSLALAKLVAVQQALATAEMTMLMAEVRPGAPLPEAVERRELAGALLWGHTADEGLRKHLENVPTVWLSSHGDAVQADVLSGNAEVGRIAAQYLIDQGCDRLAFLCPPPTIRDKSRAATAFRSPRMSRTCRPP